MEKKKKDQEHLKWREWILLKISFKIPPALWPVTTSIPMLLTGLLPHRIKYMTFLYVFSCPPRKWPHADKFWHLPCSVTDIGNGEGRNWMTTPGNTEKAARDALEWSPQEPSFSTQIPPGYKALCQQSPYLKCNRSDIKLLKTRHKNTLKEAAKWWSTRSFTR